MPQEEEEYATTELVIPHFLWSNRGPKDLASKHHRFEGKPVVASETIGETLILYPNGSSYFKAANTSEYEYTEIKNQEGRELSSLMPEGYKVFGESLNHINSGSPDLLINSIWNNNVMLSYSATLEWVNSLNLSNTELAPLIFRGTWDDLEIRKAWSPDGKYGRSNGYIVRLEDSIESKDYSNAVAKFITKSKDKN